MLTWTLALARLDYTTADAAHAAISNLITPSAAEPPPSPQGTSVILNGSRGLTHPGRSLADRVTPGGRSAAPGLDGQPVIPLTSPDDAHELARLSAPVTGTPPGDAVCERAFS